MSDATETTTRTRWSRKFAFLAALCALALGGCADDGTDGAAGEQGPIGPPGPPGDDGPPAVGFVSQRPGVEIEVLAITGGTGPAGRFLVGNTISVRYTVKTDDGDDIDVKAMNSGAIYVSGPTTNYQRVIASQSNLRAASVDNGDGTWTYTFPAPIPATYLAPLNDSPSFGAADGELTGQPLQDGTYTIGMTLRKDYEIEGEELRDPGAATADFLFGAATVLAPREVVANANCNVCHTEVRAHGEGRYDVRLCVLCHTTGAEDKNDPLVGGGTPGVSVDFKVMIHKIHNARHLPSVLGVATNPDGTLNYTVAPKPLEYAGHSLDDLSDIGFPVWPNLNVAMPKDAGYSLLSSTDPDRVIVGTTLVSDGPLLSPRAREDAIRTGVTACAKCHGDPDAGGPLLPPAQGSLHETNPKKLACASCHDDLDYTREYMANGAPMPANTTDAAADLGDPLHCATCHTVTGSSLSVRDAHIHPLVNPVVDPGVNSVITEITGSTPPGANHEIGDPVTVAFTLRNDVGTDLSLASMDSAATFFYGPSTNRQLVMPYSSPNGMSLNPFDFGGRLQATSTSNKGSMSKVFLGATAVKETLVVEFTSATAFSVNGTTSGSLGSGTLPGSPSTNPSGSSISALELGPALGTGTVTVAFTTPTTFTVSGAVTGGGTLAAATSASTRFVSPNLSFNISVGTTAAVAGNTFYIGLFRGAAANPVLFAIVAGRTAFSSTAGARDRFYHEVVPDAATYVLTIPMDLPLEFLGDSVGPATQTLTAGNLPVYYGRQQLWEATSTTALAPPASGTTFASTTITQVGGVAALDRQAEISPVWGFANGDTVAIEPAAGVGTREYVQVAPMRADGTIVVAPSSPATLTVADTATRLYFKTPLRYAHAAGARITKVTLTMRQENGLLGLNGRYTLVPAAGQVTSTTAFTTGPVNTDPVGIVMSYRTDARFGYKRHAGDTVQAYYVPPANDSADIGQEQGDWKGLPYQDGTYTADLWIYKNIDLGLQNELQTYRSTSNAGERDFLYGTATEIVPHKIISESANCYTCHNDVIFHGGGRRGVDACLTCHSISGNEDKGRWDTPNQASASPAVVPAELSPKVAIEFRQMLHKIHKGKELAHADTYVVVGNGGNSSTYEEVGFPAMPGGVRQCVRCHGNEAWHQPAPRAHASASVPVRTWTVVCGACHDTDTAQAHIMAQTAADGQESCAVCHGPGRNEDVAVVHPVK